MEGHNIEQVVLPASNNMGQTIWVMRTTYVLDFVAAAASVPQTPRNLAPVMQGDHAISLPARAFYSLRPQAETTPPLEQPIPGAQELRKRPQGAVGQRTSTTSMQITPTA